VSINTIRRGFTLVELLIVIAIIAILVGLVTVAAGHMMTRAKSTKDMANHRVIGTATWSHSVDHKGRLLHPRTAPTGPPDDASTNAQIERFWCATYGQDIDGNARVVTVTGKEVELQSALLDGAAYPYIGDLMVYQSPLDPTVGDVNEFVPGNPNITTQRIRSYSLNGYVGVEFGPDDWSRLRGAQYGMANYWNATETISQIPQPSATMCSIGEQDKGGRNLNGWVINANPTRAQWIDFPVFWEAGKVNISYVDGSTGSIQFDNEALKSWWEDPNTTGHNYVFFLSNGTPPVEYNKFRKVLLPGIIGTVLD